ncbi:NADH-ubiquinone oxidoreductase chain L [hydrothermal vent metagenome]|uniref:NADH-ubiquinone oxidoreductase chain 5 n=1 Tax=hydrothermal vent metagenome TaxID=652676 RepID=A0A3B0RXJ7_9ZZZZ
METLFKLIVFLPLVAAIVAGLAGTMAFARIGKTGPIEDDFHGHFEGPNWPSRLTTFFLVTAAVLSWIAFFDVAGGNTYKVEVLSWIRSGSFAADWTLRIDMLTAVMLVVVNTVSAIVHIYSIGYMAHDQHQPRFFAYLSLFTFAMLMLVTADNLLQMFFGWEGVGLASYLLIGFWYKKPSANAAAIKAFVVNRVGDFGFALGIFATYKVFGSIEFDTIFNAAGEQAGKTIDILGMEFDAMTTIALLLFMGAMGKSAQFLLHTWLPDAMEGPTPVSALIHAATMVTAGVFLVARMSPFFEVAPMAQTFVVIIGAITAFFAATVGLVQNDIKRVIAYSTCSQLGYMFVAMGVGAYGVGMFHLFTHAFFKALLFLGSGSVIHAMSDEQDMRKMGGLRPHLKKTYWLMIIGTLALTGFPLTAGYYSKDAVIESAFAIQTGAGEFAFWLLVIAALMTSFYSWRLIFMTFHGKPRASKEVMTKVHESPPVMILPLYVLAAGALFAGWLFADKFIGLEKEALFWGVGIYRSAENEIIELMHAVPKWVVYSPFVAMILGFAISWLFYIKRPDIPVRLATTNEPLYKFLLNKWYFDEIYDFLLVRPIMWLGKFLWKQGDGRIIDGLGPNGVAARVADVTALVVRMQSGYVYHYAFAMLLGVAGLVTYFMFASAS